MNTAATNDANKRKGIIYGAAIGDALGVPYEFLERDTFKCVNMVGNRSHHKPAGTFSDDTSMLLATLASVEEHQPFAQMTCESVFAIGTTTELIPLME